MKHRVNFKFIWIFQANIMLNFIYTELRSVHERFPNAPIRYNYL